MEHNLENEACSNDNKRQVLELGRVDSTYLMIALGLVIELEEEKGQPVHQQIGHDREGVADGIQRNALVLARAQLRNERQVGDLRARPAELEDDDERGVVDEAGPQLLILNIKIFLIYVNFMLIYVNITDKFFIFILT